MGSVDHSPLINWLVVPLFPLDGDGALFFELPSDQTVQGKSYASRSIVNKFSNVTPNPEGNLMIFIVEMVFYFSFVVKFHGA